MQEAMGSSLKELKETNKAETEDKRRQNNQRKMLENKEQFSLTVKIVL